MGWRWFRGTASGPEGALLDLLLQTCDLPGQPVDDPPLRRDGGVEILDHSLLLGQADFEARDTIAVGRHVAHRPTMPGAAGC